METRAFQPVYTRAQVGAVTSNGTLVSSVTVAASNTHAEAALPGSTRQNAACQIQIANQSAGWAYCNFGIFGALTSATVAAGYPSPPGSTVILTVDPEVTGVSVILDPTVTGNIIFSRGEGI